jgi:dUTP pyrophosphatase
MNSISVKIKKIKSGAVIPTYSKYGDAGCDLYSMEEFILEPGDICLVHTGIAIEIPYGFEGQIRPRSGKAIKEGLTVVNSPGTVDAGYRDEIRVGMINVGRSLAYIGIGDRIAQLVISPVFEAKFEEVDELSDSERGLGGFGHTGK